MKYIFLFVISLFPFYTLLSVEPTVLQEERDSFSIKADSLIGIGSDLYEQGKLKEALLFFQKSLITIEEKLGKENIYYDAALNMLALCHSSLGKYEEAIRLGTKLLIIREKTLGKEHENYTLALYNLAFYYEKIADYGSAVQLYTKVLKIIDKEIELYPLVLNNSSFCHAMLGDYQKAIKIATEALTMREKFSGKKHPDYAIALKNLALYNSYLGKYNEAIRLCMEALHIQKKLLGDELHLEYVAPLNDLALYNSYLGNYNEAIRLCMEVLHILKKLLGDELHPEYATSLNNLALYNFCLGNYSKAFQLCMKALHIQKVILGENHPKYAISLNNLATNNLALGNYNEAIRLYLEAIHIQKKTLGENHPEYATSLNNLAFCHSSLGNYNEAIHLCMKALHIQKVVLGENHPEYAASLSKLGLYYLSSGNYDEAIRLCMKAIHIQKNVLGENHPSYALLLNNLADCSASLGDYSEAIRLCTQAVLIQKRALGMNHPECAKSLNRLASYCSALGDYDEAIRLCMKAIHIQKEVLGENHPEHATSLNNLGTYNAFIGNYSKAFHLCRKATYIQKKVLGETHPEYATSLNNLSSYSLALGNYDEAIRLCMEAIHIQKEVLGENHPNYAFALNNLASCYSSLGNYTEAMQLCTEALHIQNKVLSKNHPHYVLSSHNLAYFHFCSNNKKEAVNSYSDLTHLYINLILSTFADLTTTEQALFWNKYNDYFNNELPQRAYTLADNSLYISAYNGVLLSKGLLLNAEMEMKKLLQESEDTFVVALYDETRMNKIMLNKQLEKPIKERLLDTDSLQRLINRQEQELIQRSKVYGDYTHNLRINWQDVQNKLSKEDIALEFLSFPMDGDSIMYVAMIVKPDMAYPEMIPLFEEKQLKQVPHYAYYDTSDLYHLVWQPLEEKLQGVKNIYFAPAGELYNIAIETLPDTDSTWIFDRFNLYRLSSTRQLALIQETYDNNSTRIYGGLKYDTDLTQLIRDNQRYKTEKQSLTRSFEDCFIADSLHLRSGVEELPGTRIEAENIKHSLDAAHIENDLLTDTVGTEASFKAMSGKHIRTLHIATHGFYWTKREAYKQKRLNFLMLEDNHNLKYTEDKSLTRSGLLMAGANNALIGIEIPEEVDNGILTAKEIANLDLRGMDMVVLSACQTGLGEITGDGVFGLQRGFKKAGAKSLLMSLWKVDDNATQILMTHFYANLIAGMDKHSALCEAQRMVREYEVEKTVVVNDLSSAQKRKLEKQGQTWIAQTEVRKMRPYEHPKYWAAFILLDGINK